MNSDKFQKYARNQLAKKVLNLLQRRFNFNLNLQILLTIQCFTR